MCEVNEYNPPDSIAEPTESQNEREYGDGRITMNMMRRPAQIVIKTTGPMSPWRTASTGF
jgi:hypothetical protein